MTGRRIRYRGRALSDNRGNGPGSNSTPAAFAATCKLRMSRIAVVALLFSTLVVSAVRLPASVCPASGAPMVKACVQGCCANKTCCADSQKNHRLPSPPLVKNGESHELNAVIAPSPTTAVVPIRSFDVSPNASAIYTTSSAPRLALLCTFLI